MIETIEIAPSVFADSLAKHLDNQYSHYVDYTENVYSRELEPSINITKLRHVIFTYLTRHD